MTSNRVIALLLLIVLSFSFVGCNKKTANHEIVSKKPNSIGEDIKNDFISENNKYSLNVLSSNCDLIFTEKSTNRVWRSNPEDGFTDSYATGINKTNLFSQLIVTYKSETKGLQTTNSFISSIKKKNYKLLKIKNGVRIEYTFNEGFMIPVEYYLTEKGFDASIVYSDIIEDKSALISTIDFLPFFGTAGKEDEGCILLPDGCGAVVNFKNDKKNCDVYEKKIYGIDDSLPNDYETSEEQQIYVPMFGMKKNDGCFIASITSGDGDAYIRSTVSGQENSFNTVRFKAIYRASENLSVLDGSLGTAGIVLYSSQNPTDVDRFLVSYTFLDTNSNCSDMVREYKKQLIDNNELNHSSDEDALFVDVYGGITKKKSFLGFQYDGVEKLTTFKQCKNFFDTLLKQTDSKIVIGYKKYSKSSFDSKIEIDFTPATAVGSKKAFKELIKYAENNDIELYWFADAYSYTKTGNGVSKFFDISKGLDLSGAKVYPKGLNTNTPMTNETPFVILKPDKYKEVFDKLFKNSAKYNIKNIYLGTISNSLSGDYSVDGIKRSSAIQNLSNSLKEYDGKFMTDAPNMYLWKYSTHITNLPINSSHYDIFDYDFPILQIILKGNITYSGNELNSLSNPDNAILQLYAFAENPHIGYIAEDTSKLKNSDLYNEFGLSNSYISSYMEKIKKFKQYYGNIKSLEMLSYEILDNVSITKFEKDYKLYVNYSDNVSVIDNISIDAKSVILLKNDEVIFSEKGVA